LKANAAVALLTVLACLPVAAAQAAGDPCANSRSDREVQECRDVLRIVPDLRSGVQVVDPKTITSDPARSAASLNYNVQLSECENRWVALYYRPGKSEYIYGFVYIDPQEGFTLEFGGYFTIESDGKYKDAPNPLSQGKADLKIRLEQNGIAALLPPSALAQLKLAERPDWMKFYEDTADAVTHKVSWGFFYNAIGDSSRALPYLESANSEKPDAPRLVTELAYAYNALGRPEDALRVTKDEFARNPKDEYACREMAYAYLQLQRFKEAVEQYQSCLTLCDSSEAGMAEKSELAMNLGSVYKQMGDTQNHDVWVNKARDWAPKGSAVYKSLHPDQQ